MRQVLAILFLAAALRAQGTVEGKVVATSGGTPIRKAAVLLRAAPVQQAGPLPPRSNYLTETDGNGSFSVSGVAPGIYECVPSRVGFEARPPNQFATTSFFPQVTVEDGKRITGVVLRMTPLGVISGRVLDPEGFPVAAASVQAVQYGFANGGKQILVVRQDTQSDDRGEYRLYNLFPGEHYVRASKQDMGMNFGLEIRGPKPPAYSMTYYPSALDPAQARMQDVPAGGERRPVDIHIQRRVLYSIRGPLPGPQTNGPNGFTVFQTQISVQRRPADSNFQGRFGWNVRNNQSYEIANLPPGSYMLTAQRPDPANPASRQSARAFVDIIDHDVEGIELNFAPGLEVSGVVKVASATKIPLENLQVAFEPVETGNIVNGPVKADGTFVIHNVLPDVYRVRVTPPVVAYATSVKSGGQELREAQLDLRRGGASALDLTVSADMAKVEGSVTGEDGKPAPTVNVTLVPGQDNWEWRDRFRNNLTDASGRFNFRNVIPGHYTVFAWKDAPRGAPQSAEFRKPFEKLGLSINVEAGAPMTLELKAITTQKAPQ